MTPGAAPPGSGRSSLEALRDDLIARLARMDATLAAVRTARGADNADDEHDPEGATLSHEWSRIAGLRADAQRQLDQANRVLGDFSDGTYGICVDCLSPIPLERLDVLPTATRCVACAEKAGL